MPGSPFRRTPPADAGFDPVRLADLDTYLEGLVRDGHQPGISVLLTRGEDLVLDVTHGHADLEERLPLTADTIFSLYSLTKPLTAVAMLLLHEEGAWQLDDPVDEHLPELGGWLDLPGNPASRVPTLRETFTHTAGVNISAATPQEKAASFEAVNWMTARSLDEQVDRLARMPLAHEPGSSWAYSFACDLQAAIVERHTGQRLDLFLQDKVFAPLGMTDTTFTLSYEQHRRRARGYAVEPTTGGLRPALPAERLESTFPLGGTSLSSTARDYLLLARMLLGRGTLHGTTVLQPESVAMMLDNHLDKDLMGQEHAILHYRIGGGHGYGLNGLVCVDPVAAGRPVGRGTYEWGGAFGAFFWIDPEHDIACVGMASRARIDEPRPMEVVAQEIVYDALRA